MNEDVDRIRKLLSEKESDYRTAVRTCTEEVAGLSRAEERLGFLGEAQELAQDTAQQVQQKVHSQIAGVVSRCLEAVFSDEAYKFKIYFEQKRGRTEARSVFQKDGHDLDPMNGSGGGVIDIASFALRVARLLLTQPPLRRVITLDEPFKFVSEEYRPQVKQMLEELSKDMGIQIIMTTHIEELKIGKVIELRMMEPKVK